MLSITRQQIIDIFTAIRDAVQGVLDVDVTTSVLPTGAATEAKQDDLIATDFATQVTSAAILTKLADVDITTLPSIPAGTNAIGSVDVDTAIQEYQWLSTDLEPTPAAGDRVFGIEINAVTHAMTVKYWTGAAWEDLA